MKTNAPTTLDELASYPKEMLTPDTVAGIIGCDPQSIRSQAQIDARALGFHVCVVKSRVYIPRRAFLDFMGYYPDDVQRRNSHDKVSAACA